MGAPPGLYRYLNRRVGAIRGRPGRRDVPGGVGRPRRLRPGESGSRAWLYGIATNLVRRQLRPDEVASTGTARMIKLARYAKGEIAKYLIVDPAVPSIRVFDLVECGYRPSGQASRTGR
ncbi:MAG TPA: hypothetical protein VIU11_23285 [Nakamurella sp.]